MSIPSGLARAASVSLVDIPVHHAETGDSYVLQFPVAVTAAAGSGREAAGGASSSSSSSATAAAAAAAPNTTVEELRLQVAQYADIEPRDMILLCGPPFVKLEPSRSLRSYGLLQQPPLLMSPRSESSASTAAAAAGPTQKEVFLFCRSTFSERKSRAKNETSASSSSFSFSGFLRMEQLEPQRVPFPETLSSSSGMSQTDIESLSPLQKSIYDFDLRMRLQNEQGVALSDGAQLRVDSCLICLNQSHVQLRALRAALSNLDDHCVQIKAIYQRFFNLCAEQQKRNEEVLDSFDKDLDALRHISVPSALYPQISSQPASSTQEDSGKKTLYDFVPMNKVLSWRQEAKRHVELFHTRLSELEALEQSIRESSSFSTNTSADSIFPKMASIQKTLEAKEAYVRELLEKQQHDSKILTDEFNEISPTVESGIKENPSSSLLVQIGSMIKAHDAVIQEMKSRDGIIHEEMDHVARLKLDTSNLLVEQLRFVARVQSKVRDLGNKIEALKEALGVQKTLVSQIAILGKIPESYQAALDEIVRRRQFGIQYRTTIQKLADSVAHMCEIEMSKRETFVRKHAQNLPGGLFQDSLLVLSSTNVPSCDISQRPFDENLPVLEIAGKIAEEGVEYPSEHEEDEDIAQVRIENLALRMDIKEVLAIQRRHIEEKHEKELQRHQARILELESLLKSAPSPRPSLTGELEQQFPADP